MARRPLPAALAARPPRADGLTEDFPARPPVAPARFGAHPAARLVAFIGLTLAVFLVEFVVAFAIDKYLPDLARAVEHQAMELVAVVGGYLLVALLLERRRPPVELALRRGRGVLGGLAAGAALMALWVGVIALLGGYRADGLARPAPVAWAMMILTGGVVAGVVEEVIFRGVIYRYVEEGFGSWAALAISAAIFGAAHLGNPNATWLLAVGIALEAGILFAALYALTRSLWVCLGLHAAWNITQGVVFGSAVSGVDGRGIIASHPTGPDALSGGALGIEGSLVTIVGMTVLGLLVAWLAHRRGMIVAPAWVRRRRVRESVSSAG